VRLSLLQVGVARLSALIRVQGQWTDAGRSAHSLSVDWQARGTKGGLCWRATRDGLRHVFAPKMQKTRAVPINAETRKVLEAWALGRKNEFVFYNFETGKPFVDLKTGFAQACRKAGITGVTWKTLRHTFASRLVNRGVDIVTVQQLLGHSAVTVTMRYTHTNLDSKHAAVAKLERFGDSMHQNAATEREIVTKRRYKLQCFSGLVTERWPRG
jgi:integrase